jgi:flagellar biosynthesis/type III secretory pathway M-ring protein FliF/YscJ
MSGYVKWCLAVSGLIATVTFAVSIPVNLLGTSLLRALLAFLLFAVLGLGLRWLFRLLSTDEPEVEEENGDSPAGKHIDWQTPEDQQVIKDVYASPEEESPKTEPFQPLRAPKLKPDQVAEVIRKQSFGSDER